MDVTFCRGKLSLSSTASLQLSVGFIDSGPTLSELCTMSNRQLTTKISYLFPPEWLIYRRDSSAYPYITRIACKIKAPEGLIIVLAIKLFKFGRPKFVTYGFIEVGSPPEVFVRLKRAPSLFVKTGGTFKCKSSAESLLEIIGKHKQTIWW